MKPLNYPVLENGHFRNAHTAWTAASPQGSFEPKCMYRLLFASVQLHVFWKSLICIRPLDRLVLLAVALLGVRTRLCLISGQVDYDHLGSQTLGAFLFRSMHLRFTNVVCG
ncbi:MAG: hypothetical protein WBV78_04850, partial [Roseobacter sp.]